MAAIDPKQKKLMLLFGGLALFAAALIFGTNILLKLVPQKQKPEESVLPPIQTGVDVRIQAPGGTGAGNEGPIYEIRDGAPQDDRPVTYTAAGFSPAEVTIRASDAAGCVITVTNKSDAPLRVRVGPHDPAGDPGADYGVLAPNEIGILDVRYPGLTQITLHDHDRPAYTFLVRYGEGCR